MFSKLLLTAALFAPYPIAPNYTLASCDDPIQRDQILSDPEKIVSTDAIEARSHTEATGSEALMDKLAARASLSEKPQAEIFGKVSSSPEYQGVMENGRQLQQRMDEESSALKSSKDDLAACRSFIRTAETLVEIGANADRGYAIMRKIIEDEAKSRGVSLTD